MHFAIIFIQQTSGHLCCYDPIND